MIQSVDRAIRILRELQGARTLGLTELAGRLQLAASTVHGLLRTLAAGGMVEQDGAGRYTLGPAVLGLGHVYLDGNELRLRSLGAAEALSERTGHAVRVAVLLGTDAIVVHHVSRPDGGRPPREVGSSVPAHASALGKALLAFHPAAHTLLPHDRPLPRLTGRTIADRGELDDALTRTHADGVAHCVDEAVIGQAEVAAPIFGPRTVAGAIGVVLPSPEHRPDGPVTHAVREAAIAISRGMGAASWPVTTHPARTG
ncbi:MAG TPA: IclR family transcriptional regulator [Pseudonocardiaceae bacterium]